MLDRKRLRTKRANKRELEELEDKRLLTAIIAHFFFPTKKGYALKKRY